MQQPMIGEPAPSFVLPSVTGETVSLADLRGRYLVIHFGTSW
jgi:peroxiredoxin